MELNFKMTQEEAALLLRIVRQEAKLIAECEQNDVIRERRVFLSELAATLGGMIAKQSYVVHDPDIPY